MRTLATAQTAQDIARLEIPLGDGRRLRLDQLADVTDTTAEPRAMALMDGRPVVAFEVMRARGAGELEVADAARAVVAALRLAHPELVITEAVNHVDPVAENYRGSMMLLFEGAALAVLVVFCFLRDWRATLIAAIALPLSAIPTFAAMHLMGFTLNTVSLLSLSLVIGVLVDDAIVEIENIGAPSADGQAAAARGHRGGQRDRAGGGGNHLHLDRGVPATSLMGGTVGRYFVQFGWTAAVAVFFSLVVARMLTPTDGRVSAEGGPSAAQAAALDLPLSAGRCAPSCGIVRARSARPRCW